MSKQILSQNFQYIFHWDDLTKEYNNNLSTFNEMILIIRNIFKEKFFEEISIKIFYMDVDEDSFEIHSANEFQQVKDYHSTMPEINKDKYKIRLKIIEKKLDISSLLSSSKLNISESNTILYDNKFGESLLQKNKKALFDKDNLTSIISKELKSLKDLMVLNTQEMKDYFTEFMDKKISTFENKIEIISKELNEFKENREEIIKSNDKIKNVEELKISKEVYLEFSKINEVEDIVAKNKQNNLKINKKEIKNEFQLKDEEIYLNAIEEKDIYVCTICFVNNAKFSCAICDNLFLCNRCEYSDSHQIHPRVSLNTFPHFNLENLSKTVYSKNNFTQDGEIIDKIYKKDFLNITPHEKKLFYLDLNRNFFGKKLSPIKIEIIINSIEGIFEKLNGNIKILNMKTEETLKLPITIKNLSNFNIKPFEMLITAKYTHPLKIENNIIRTKIQKNASIDTFMEIKANMIPGDYKFEIDLFHISRKVELNPVIILVNVTENLKLSPHIIIEKSEFK